MIYHTFTIFNEITQYKIIFGFIKKIFITAMTFYSCNAMRCVSMKNQECNVRPVIMNIDSDDPSFYPYNIQINKCNGSCNTINDPYAKLCDTDAIKDMNIKVFNLMSRTNKT